MRSKKKIFGSAILNFILTYLVLFNKYVVKLSFLSVVTPNTSSCLTFLRVSFHNLGQFEGPLHKIP